MAALSSLSLGVNSEGAGERIVLDILVDTPTGQTALKALFDTGCSVNLINQDVMTRLGIPALHAKRTLRARFLDSHPITVWNSHDLTVTTADDAGELRASSSLPF